MEHLTCGICNRTFIQKSSLTRHIKNSHGEERRIKCSNCNRTYNRLENLKRHQKHCTAQQTSTPSIVGKKRKPRKSAASTRSNNNIIKSKTALKGAVETWTLNFTNDDEETNFTDKIQEAIERMVDKIEHFRKENFAIKFNMALRIVFEKATDPDVVSDPPVVLPSEQFELYKETNISPVLKTINEQLINRIDVYEACGSGWVLSRLVALDLTLWRLDPLRASSNSTFQPLPTWIVDKKAVINIKNEDELCFKWSILVAFHHKDSSNNKNSVYSYTKYDNENYDFSMLTFPVKITDISKFERKNNISVNVYGVDETQDTEDDENERYFIYPIKVTEKEIENRHVNLLVIETTDGYHYTTIVDFSRLLSNQYNKHHGKTYFCYSCLHGFTKKPGEETRADCKLLQKHREFCKTQKPQRIEFPKDDKINLRFTNINKQLPCPFVAYCDFESLLKKVDSDDLSKYKTGIAVNSKEKEEPPKKKKKETSKKKKKETTKKEKKETPYQEHEAISYGFKIVSIDPSFHHDLEIYKGENAAEKFLDALQDRACKIHEKYIEKIKPMTPLTEQEQKLYNDTTTCHICKEHIDDDKDKVKDHCHL